MIRVGDLEITNPVCVAAGPWSRDITSDKVGAIFTKSITLNPMIGRPYDVFPYGEGYINRVGLAGPGVDRVIELELPALLEVGPPVIASVHVGASSGVTATNWEQVIIRLEKVDGIAGYELNTSCPNVHQMVPKWDEVVAKARKLTKRPIWLKIGFRDGASRAFDNRDIRQAGADALTISNSIPAGFWHNKAYVEGGLSGPSLKPLVMQKVGNWPKGNVGPPVFACGGIESVDDVRDYLMLGAVAVQVGSAHLKDGLISDTLAGAYERKS